jgi:uncharacterized protein YgiM (DUF1202 family)
MQESRTEARRARARACGALAIVALAAAAMAARAISPSLGALAAQTASETVVVESDKVTVRDIAASYGEPVGTAKTGDRLAVVSRKGKWIQVKLADGKTGWVAESALAKKDSAALDAYADVAGRRDAKTASGSDDTTAAKGGEEFDKLAKARGWDKDKVYAIEKRKVDPEAVRRFAAEGMVGGGSR